MQFTQGNNLPKVKLSNQAAIHRMVYQRGPITRAEIAGRLGLTLPTITTNINRMIARGIVREAGSFISETNAAVRKASLIDIVPGSRYFVGVEMRAVARHLCVTDYRGNVVYSREETTNRPDYEENIRATCGMLRETLTGCGVPSGQIAGVGFCVPGLVDGESGILRNHPGYHWVNRNIPEDVARLAGWEGHVAVENNACARAFGAQLFRRELLNDVLSFAYFFISAGIACPLIVKSLDSSGILVGSGEVGHMVMNPNGPRCSCGNRGCLETYSSDRTIVTLALEALRAGEAPALKALCGDGTPTIAQLLQAQTDPAIRRIVDTAISQLGIAIANINNFVRPHSLLIEGKLFQSGENQERLLETVRRNLYTTHADTRFLFIEPEAYSGARGAAAMAILNDLNTYIE